MTGRASLQIAVAGVLLIASYVWLVLAAFGFLLPIRSATDPIAIPPLN